MELNEHGLMKTGSKRYNMSRYPSDVEDAMSMEICSETVHRIKNMEERKIKKIKTLKDLPESLIKKDHPRKQWDLRSTKIPNSKQVWIPIRSKDE